METKTKRRLGAVAGGIAPANVAIGTITCTTAGLTTTATIPVSWSSVNGATQYTVESGRVLNLVQGDKTVTGTSRRSPPRRCC